METKNITSRDRSDHYGEDTAVVVVVVDDPTNPNPDTNSPHHSHPSSSSSSSSSSLFSPSKHNFWHFSIVCSAVPACALACLALATAELGSTVGAVQSGILYATYTGASVLGLALWVVQQWGSKQAVWLGQVLFGGGYVVCFWLAALLVSFTNNANTTASKGLAWMGAAIGGVGAAILWTAQGVYFAQAAENHAIELSIPLDEATRQFSGIFAVCFLLEETALDVLSTVMVKVLGVPWGVVFALYASIALIATLSTRSVDGYPRRRRRQEEQIHDNIPIRHHHQPLGVSCCSSEVTATVGLLIRDSKVKYMMGFNAAFGFAGAFLNSFVSGQVVPELFDDASYVGLFVALHGFSAALASVIFARWRRKGLVLIVGAGAFAGVAVPFLLQPDVPKQWTWVHLAVIYILEGIGRATFEGNLKAIFADWFPHDREAAFANITLQNGLASSVAYVLTSRLPCDSVSRYCVAYRDGSLHNVGTFAWIVVGTSLAAVLGYWRASSFSNHDDFREGEDKPLNKSSGSGSSTDSQHGGCIEMDSTMRRQGELMNSESLPEVT